MEKFCFFEKMYYNISDTSFRVVANGGVKAPTPNNSTERQRRRNDRFERVE